MKLESSDRLSQKGKVAMIEVYSQFASCPLSCTKWFVLAHSLGREKSGFGENSPPIALLVGLFISSTFECDH